MKNTLQAKALEDVQYFQVICEGCDSFTEKGRLLDLDGETYVVCPDCF